MDFITALGLASDGISLAGVFYDKLKKSDAQWKAFLSLVKKLVNVACREYKNYIKESYDHKDIIFIDEYEELLYKSLCTALEENRPFGLEMVLPLEKEFPESEKRRLYELLARQLQHSIEYVVRDSQITIQDQLQMLMEYVNNVLSSTNKIFHSIEKNREGIEQLLISPKENVQSFSNGNRDVEFAYEQAYKNAIYSSHAYDVVPNELFQRNDELELLEKICKHVSGYFLFQAKAYTGKSGLLSWFFTHPPKNVWLVGYFLIRRIGFASSERFEKTIKSQLIALISLSLNEKLSVDLREKTIVQLLEKAAIVAQEHGKRLVLVIDGLDEGINTHYVNPAVLNMLPKNNIPNLIIILSCRPHPNVFDNANLPSDHASRRSNIYELSQSKYVKDIKILAQAELQELYEDEKTKRLIALLAVSQGVLTVADLCAITNATYQIDVKKIFNDSKGRIFMSVTPELPLTMAEESEKGYAFAHDIFQERALNDLVGNNAHLYIEMIDEWCDSYLKQRWPLDTPLYLFTDYLRLLAHNLQWDKLADLLIDDCFINLILQKNISCSLYFDLIKKTIVGLSEAKTIDLTRIGLLSETREMLALRDDNIPVELPILFAKIGDFDAAQKMTETMSEADRLFSLSQIALIMAKCGKTIDAVSTAQNVVDAIPFEMFPYQRSNFYECDYTKYLSNCAEAFIASNHSSKAESFFSRLITVHNLGVPDRHRKHEMMFSSLREIVLATAKAGDMKSALREVQLLSFDWQTKGFTLVKLGVLQALQGDFEGAIKSAEEAYLINYYNDGQCNENNRHGNEHLTLECAKVLKIIEMLTKVEDGDKLDRKYTLKIVFPIDGHIKYLSFSDLLAESNVQKYWDHFVSKMYVEIANEFLNLGFCTPALEAIESAYTFLQKYKAEYKYVDSKETDMELVQIAQIETSCSNIQQALLFAQEIQNIDKTIKAYTTIAREAYKNGHIDEAEIALFEAEQKIEKCNKMEPILEVVLATALIKGTEAAIAILPESTTVKDSVAWFCKIAEERLVDNDINDAKMMARKAFAILSSSDYNLVSLDEYHLKKHVLNPIDISKSLFDIGEYDLALNIAAISGKAKWHAKLLMKTAHTVVYNNKDWAIKLFEKALNIIETYKIDVNSDSNYEKDEPSLMDFVIMSRLLLEIGDKDSAISILPSYSEYSKLLWQSTNIYAYEALYIYFILGAKSEIESDLITIENPVQLKYAKAWLAVVENEFNEVDFSDVVFTLTREVNSQDITINYKDEYSDELTVKVDKSIWGLEYNTEIPIKFYETLENLESFHKNHYATELQELLRNLAIPYEGENHYGMQENWCVRRILLIRKLHELGILKQNESIVSDLENFLSDKDTLRDKLVWIWSETLIFINQPVGKIMENIKITFNKRYRGEHYNPDRPNIVRALAAVLKKYPDNSDALDMIRTACRGYIENTYSYDYKALIEAQKSLSIDLGLKDAFLCALQTKPWYDMIDLFAHLDLQALQRITRTSYDRITAHMEVKV